MDFKQPLMKNITNKFCISVLLLSITLLISACGNNQQSKENHLNLAKKLLLEKQYAKARIEAKNVLQIDPNNAQAHTYLGQIEEHREEWKTAFLYYKKAVELDPEQLFAQVRMGHFLLRQASRLKGKEKADLIAKVQKHIKATLQHDPSNINGLILKASLDFQTKKLQVAIVQLNNIIKKAPKNIKAILLLTLIYEKQNDIEKIQQVLEKGLTNNPKNSELYLHAARFFSQHKKIDRAINTLNKLINTYPESLEFRLKLASYYLTLKRDNDAEFIYKGAIKANPLDVERHLALAEFISVKRSSNDAITFLKQSIKTLPNEPMLKVALAIIYGKKGDSENSIPILNELISSNINNRLRITAQKELAKTYALLGDTDKVEKITRQILTESQNDYDALLIGGKNAMLLKQYSTAVSNFNLILKNQPDLISVLLLLSEAYQRQNNIILAEQALKKILVINPYNVQANVGLARYSLVEKNDEQAFKYLKTALTKQPEHLPALILSSELLARNSNIKALIPVLNKIKEIAPNSPEGWFRMSRMHLALKNFDLAQEEMLTAWEKSSDSIDLLAELIDIEIILKKYNQSRKRLNKILTKDPKHKTAHKFLGMISLAENKPELAEKEFILQLKTSPKDILTHMELAKISNSKGDFDKSADYYEQALEYKPDDLHLIFGLASTREKQQRYQDAITLYNKILDKKPDDAISINNLAMLLVNHKSDKESHKQARILAEKFIGKNEPIYMDTLGWVYYKIGKYEKALPALEYAVRHAPKVAIFQYHLGITYAQMGHNDKARTLLQNAINAKYFPGKKHAKSVLQNLN